MLNLFCFFSSITKTNKNDTEKVQEILSIIKTAPYYPIIRSIVDPHRIQNLKKHRKLIKHINGRICESSVMPKPPKEQKMSLNDNPKRFKYVTLNQLDTQVDHVLNGYIITVTLIDIPCIGLPYARFIIEDELNFVENLEVYNLGRDFEKIRREFKVGDKFDLFNPYVNVRPPETSILRIDDPKSMKLVGHVEKMCRYCGRSGSKFSCGMCNNADYCSKECQSNDSAHAEHKFICNKN